VTSHRLATGSAGFKSWVSRTTAIPGQTVRVASLARDRLGRPVPNLKVSLTWTYGDGHVVKTTAYTDATGRVLTNLPITDETPLGIVKVVAHTQSGSENRVSSTSFRRN